MALPFAKGFIGLRDTPKARRRLRLQVFLCGVAAGADAVGDPDAAVGVARESQTGQLLAETLHAGEALEVSNAVLRHSGLPFVDAGEERLGPQTHNLLQLVAHDGDDLMVSKRPHILGVPSCEEAAQQRSIVGSAMRKLVVDESRGQQFLAFAARHQKSKARGKRLANFAIKAEAYRDGGTVLDCSKFGR